MDGMTDTERLMAIEEIKRLKARRDRAVDTKNWDLLRSLHAPDHVSDNDEYEPWIGRDIMLENIASRLTADKISVHHSHTPDITFESPTSAKGVWAMEDNIYWKQEADGIWEDHWLRGFGFYHESYEKRDGQWVFTRRRLERLHVTASPGARF